MTINELLHSTAQYQLAITLFLIAIPLLSFGYNAFHKPETRISTPHKYVYSVLIYASAIPGAIGFTLTAYTLFFTRQDLLNVNFVIYFLPVISMIASLVIIAKETDLSHIPGFHRILGLFVMLVLSMFCALMLLKVRIFIGFFASPIFLVGAIVLIFGLFKWGASKFCGGSAK